MYNGYIFKLYLQKHFNKKVQSTKPCLATVHVNEHNFDLLVFFTILLLSGELTSISS